MGNLAWHGGSSGGASSGGGGGEVHGVPAESGADRAERQAEGDFERLVSAACWFEDAVCLLGCC